MAKNILNFWKQAAADITDTSSILDTSAILDRSVILDTKKILDKSEILGTENDNDNNNDKWNTQRIIVAHFVLCTSHINESEESDSLLKNILVQTFSNMVTVIFKEIFEINTKFTFSFCKDNELPEGLNFSNLEEFKTIRRKIESFNSNKKSEKKINNKSQIDRGIKVIEILPESTDLTLHSNAEKSGIVAHIYLHHLIKGGFRNSSGATVRQFKTVEFDITLIHEICHLLGLSDRYQFQLIYKLGENGDCIESLSRTLIPYAVDPKLDEEALNLDIVLNNLMYGVDNFCLKITTYQKKVILGYLDPEPDYDKVTVLVPEGNSLTTNTYNGNARKKINLYTIEKKDALLIGVDPISGTYTYMYSDGELKQDFSRQNIKIDGKPVGDKLNEQIGILVMDENGNIQSSSNRLGKDITSLNYCHGRTINPVKSQSNGN